MKINGFYPTHCKKTEAFYEGLFQYIRSLLKKSGEIWIWSHLLKKSLMENFIFSVN